MDEQDFLDSLENLTGKVAIVTGGSQGIGLQTTIYLARLGGTVYVCALDTEKDRAGVASAQEALKSTTARPAGSIHFHALELGSIESARKSAESFKTKLDERGKPIERLDIIVGNAGTAFQTLDKLSPDGFERTFAVNCLGHYVFVTSLLDLVERTAAVHGEARISLTSSHGYKWAKKLDYGYLTTAIPGDGTSLRHLNAGFQRYCDSKLAVLYLALQLNRQLEKRGVKNVFVNACHPGNSPKTDIGDGQQPLVSAFWQRALKEFLGLFLRNSTRDAAKTQVVLSASKRVAEEKVGGEFWVPVFSWFGYYLRSEKEELATELARDEGEWKKLWECCESAVAEYDAQRTS